MSPYCLACTYVIPDFEEYARNEIEKLKASNLELERHLRQRELTQSSESDLHHGG
jgi:hypothetical protein